MILLFPSPMAMIHQVGNGKHHIVLQTCILIFSLLLSASPFVVGSGGDQISGGQKQRIAIGTSKMHVRSELERVSHSLSTYSYKFSSGSHWTPTNNVAG